MKSLSRGKVLWSVAASLALAALLAVLVPAKDWTALMEQTLEEKSLVHALVVFCAAYVAATLVLIPAWIFPIAAGAAFGPAWGLAAALGSSTLAALCAFLIARFLVRDRIERVARRNDTFAAVDKAMGREPAKVVALLRLSPVLPSGLKSYFLGLTCVDPVTYVLASAAGMLPGIALKVYLGDVGRGALGGGGPWKWALLAAGILATVAMATIVARVARKRLGL